VALFIRLYELGRIPSALFIDEVWAVYQPYLYQTGLINLSLYSIVVYFLQGTYFTYQIFGPSVLFGRLSVAIYGTLLVAVVYFLAKEMFNLKIGLFSAILIALCPWAVIFSRYQISPMTGFFWFTLAIYFTYKGSKIKSRKRWLVCGLGSFILGLSLASIVISRIFVPLFLLGFVILHAKRIERWTRWTIMEGLIYLALFLLASSPVIYDHIYPSSGVVKQSVIFSTFSHSDSVSELVKLVGERFYLHFSPDFLLLTGGFSFAGTKGSQPMFSTEGLLKYSTGAVGMLNYYGVLVYPAICYLVYKTARKKSTIEERLLLWWIFSYLLTSTIAYYDNPNAARYIIGLPALIISIAVFIDCIYAFMNTSFMTKKSIRLASTFGIIMIILLPTIYFSTDYFYRYSARSAKSFDYGYKEIAQFLTETDNWKRPIFLYSLPDRNWNLAFYSPRQPVNPDRFSVVFPPFNFSALRPHNAFIQIKKPVDFEEGTIEYKTRMDKGYGAASSSHIQLVRDENNIFRLSINFENPTYNPSGYLLSQKANGQLYVLERSLNKVMDYNEWRMVKLVINKTTVSFYFDGELITIWSRPTNDVYHYINLCGESGGVSFTDFKIKYSGESKFINILEKDNVSDWQIISGTWAVNQNIFRGDVSAILIIPGAVDLQFLRENNVEYEILKAIYYPEGNLAFTVILIV